MVAGFPGVHGHYFQYCSVLTGILILVCTWFIYSFVCYHFVVFYDYTIINQYDKDCLKHVGESVSIN